MVQRADVFVIGGGLVGCATAYHLAKRGAQVVLSERGQLNRQASGQNAGSLHFQLEFRMVRFWKELEKEMGELIPMSITSEKMWQGLEEELQADMEVIQHGGFMVAETAEELELLKKKYELEKKWSLNTELLTGEEARGLAPYLSKRVIGAAFCPLEGHANPRLVTPQYAKRASEFGATILTESRVTDLTRRKGKWLVQVNGEERYEAEHIVLAAGAWIEDLAEMLGLHIPMFAVPLTMNVTEPTTPFIHHMIQHVGKRITLKQVRDGNVLIGGGWSSKFAKRAGKLDFSQAPIILPEAVQQNCEIAMELVPHVGNLRLLRSWPGVTGITADQLPLLGEVPERKGVWIAAGGSGFTFGPLYGSILADLIMTGSTDFKIDAFLPKKLSHLNLFMS
ncbi:NAD(P)/FAD-dependent oxidoreductase [Bacillus horti]|uniref:Glycine/D-amino acid oxidase-like deaminating enzyme n=1 Tax=Caldalkalibacillus horti TaxID=77523 RepID=A0ABT9W409_9BACI|nr:FAD-binding oxidoreductase [Bacillus horti]MDQ0167971.1 glycine/D-amino acid oxidase-like deaminating enzyme [Bacillus horti]